MGMQERIHALQGEIQIDSQPGRGSAHHDQGSHTRFGQNISHQPSGLPYVNDLILIKSDV